MATMRKTPHCSVIHNAVYTDSRFLALKDPLAQLVYVAALGLVDTFGNISADFARLRTLILPMHALKRKKIEAIFRDFEKVGLAFFYECNGGRYVHLQLTHNARIHPPEYPLLPGLSVQYPKDKGRRAIYRIFDNACQECDVDGDPVDRNLRRVAPLLTRCTSDGRTGDVPCPPNITEQKQNRTECSVFVPKTETTQQGRAGAGTPLGGVPTAALPVTEKEVSTAGFSDRLPECLAGRAPSLVNLKGNGGGEQDADLVILLDRPDQNLPRLSPPASKAKGKAPA